MEKSSHTAADPDILLSVEDLCIDLSNASDDGRASQRRHLPSFVRLIDTVNFEIRAGETLALLGESGSGKSVTAAAIAGLLASNLVITSGKMHWARQSASNSHDTAIVFQQPRQALNPIRRIGQQLGDALRATGVRSSERRETALSLLRDVAIETPGKCLQAYPHMLSGVTCQRVLLALSLASAPRLLIADEPTTGLDTVTQAHALDLIDRLARERKMAVLLITHDLAMALQRAQRIAIMHAGQIVEILDGRHFLQAARHPYTRQLIASTPRFIQHLEQLTSVVGQVPDLRRRDLPACRFQPRCARATSQCISEKPPRHTVFVGNVITHCWHPETTTAHFDNIASTVSPKAT